MRETSAVVYLRSHEDTVAARQMRELGQQSSGLQGRGWPNNRTIGGTAKENGEPVSDMFDPNDHAMPREDAGQFRKKLTRSGLDGVNALWRRCV